MSVKRIPFVDHQIYQLEDLPQEKHKGQYKENHEEGQCDFLQNIADLSNGACIKPEAIVASYHQKEKLDEADDIS